MRFSRSWTPWRLRLASRMPTTLRMPTRRMKPPRSNHVLFAVLTLEVRSLMSSMQSARRVSKADEGSTSSPLRRSCLRNGGERIHVRILSLNTVQMPEPYLLTQTQYRSRPSMAGILPYGETCRNCAPQGESVDLRYGLYTVAED